MYLRTVKAKGAEGVEFEYIRLVEAYWEDGHSKQRVVANLGRKDLLAPHLESLIELLGGAKKSKSASRSCGEPIEATVAACWGPMLVARSLWREFGLESIVDGLAPKTNTVLKTGRLPLADRVLVLVANRLSRPGSEHALAQWLESDFACGRDGKRILARWKQQGRVRGRFELAPRVVSHAGPVVGAQGTYRGRTLCSVARSAPPTGRDGLLRPNKHLF